MQKHRGEKCTTADWFEVMQKAEIASHKYGLKSAKIYSAESMKVLIPLTFTFIFQMAHSRAITAKTDKKAEERRNTSCCLWIYSPKIRFVLCDFK